MLFAELDSGQCGIFLKTVWSPYEYWSPVPSGRKSATTWFYSSHKFRKNTGNIARTPVLPTRPTHHQTHGFPIDDRKMKRAGLDCWDKLDVRFYDSLDDFMRRPKLGGFIWFLSLQPPLIQMSAMMMVRFIILSLVGKILVCQRTCTSMRRKGPVYPHEWWACAA